MHEEKKFPDPHSAGDCPITSAIDVIGGKWKPPILWLLMKEGTLRFGELSRILPDMALKVLSRSLKELAADGMIVRTVYAEVPPRVEYSLSARGESLRGVLEQLSEWSRTHLSGGKATDRPAAEALGESAGA